MSEAKEQSVNGKPGGAGHETRDVSVGNLAAFGLILLALIVLGMLVSWAVESYDFAHQSLGPTATPFENVRQLPPVNRPPLQTAPAEDMNAFRLKERKVLDSYGWVDPKAGFARIPIERAMAILIQKGFPSQVAGSSTGKEKESPRGIVKKPR